MINSTSQSTLIHSSNWPHNISSREYLILASAPLTSRIRNGTTPSSKDYTQLSEKGVGEPARERTNGIPIDFCWPWIHKVGEGQTEVLNKEKRRKVLMIHVTTLISGKQTSPLQPRCPILGSYLKNPTTLCEVAERNLTSTTVRTSRAATRHSTSMPGQQLTAKPNNMPILKGGNGITLAKFNTSLLLWTPDV